MNESLEQEKMQNSKNNTKKINKNQEISKTNGDNIGTKYKIGSIKLLCKWVTGLAIISMISSLSGFVITYENISSIIIVNMIQNLIGIFIFILSLILLFRFWNVIPVINKYLNFKEKKEYDKKISPAKAVGFSLIPIFSFIWLYIVYVRLVRHINKLLSQLNFDIPVMSVMLPRILFIIFPLYFILIILSDGIQLPRILIPATFYLTYILFIVMINKISNRIENINQFLELKESQYKGKTW